ncbi:hypothetical protein KM043_006363 [Ampulex compressa]|nr:hypothetical protein KM043_006363 [Ampulex compressa]
MVKILFGKANNMFRFPISVLIFSLSASYICLATDKANDTTKIEFQSMGNNGTVVDEHLGSIARSTENQSDAVTTTASLSSTEGKLVSNADPSPLKTDKNETQKAGECSYVKEQKDMNDCVVTPHDDDDVPTQAPNLNATESPIPMTTGNEENSIQPAKIFPDGKDVKTLQTVDKSVAAQLNRTLYEIYTKVDNSADNHTTVLDVIEIPHTNTKEHINYTQLLMNSTSSLLVHDIKELDGVSKTGNDESTIKSMPSGIIALVTAITFAIVVIVAYISLIAWRRYLEYKYGHRELLVNDLEFDTNDLRHFEL